MITPNQMAVLGCVFLNSKHVIGLCVKAGAQSHWFDGEARKLYDFAMERYVNGKDTDSLIATRNATTAVMDLADACLEAVETITYAQHYIEELGLEVLENEALILADQTRLLVEGGVGNIQEFVESTARKWGDLVLNDTREFTDEEVGAQLLDRWESPDRDADRITWPLPSLNEAIGTLEQEYVFLAASPSVGKTALMLQMCDTLGHLHNPNSMITSVASLESPASMIQPRRIGRVAGVNTWKLKNGYGKPGDFVLARETNKLLTKFKTRFHYSGMNLDQIRAWATREKAAGSRLLVIDNMKHVRMNAGRSSTPELFMKTSMGLKHIRDDIGLPMIVLHHLNKDGDMAWSTDIERDADIVLYLSENEEMSIKATEANGYHGMDVVNLEVRKNRDGARYITKHLNFVKGFQEFKEMA